MDSKVTYILHGFNVKDEGKATTGRLRPALIKGSSPQHYVRFIKYGWFGLLSVLFRNKKVAASIKDSHFREFEYEDGAIGVGHSNGCAILVEAARQGVSFDKLLLINPALKVDTVFPDNIREIYVIHTTHDRPTKSARFFDRIPFIGLLIPNAWGAMGAYGYDGRDGRVTNMDLSHSLKGHSDIFSDENIERYADSIAQLLYKGD